MSTLRDRTRSSRVRTWRPCSQGATGRFTSPLSFGEYRSYFGEQGTDDFDGFIRRGGLAGSYDYDGISESYGYIRDVYKTILTRDLVQKFSLPDSAVLERLAEYMMGNSGNLNSPNNIANVLDANRVPINHVTVGRYISYLRDAFVFYEARRYDIKGKKRVGTQAKHYACDSGMRYAVLGTRDMDWGRMYENAAFLELMGRGYEAYVGKLYQKEVDFVAKRGSELVYIQVSDDISSESTLERELVPLLSVRDAFPKVLVARTRHEPYAREGVLVLTSRGGCSASRGSERHTGISLDRARRAVRARTGNAVAVWAAESDRLDFAKQAYRARAKRSRQQRSPNPFANSWASHLRLLISPTSNEDLRPAVLQTA